MLLEILKISQMCYRHRLMRMGTFFEKLLILTNSASISGKAQIGERVSFSHGGIGVIIHPMAKIGNDCLIGAGVVIGNRFPDAAAPKIGNNVYIGVGAKILGGVSIGDNSMIGANAVVTDNVPEGCVAVGVPAKVVGKTRITGLYRDI